MRRHTHNYNCFSETITGDDEMTAGDAVSLLQSFNHTRNDSIQYVKLAAQQTLNYC